MAAASHGRLLLGAATASATCYLLWRFYRRRQSGARPVASEQLQLHEEADTLLRRWAPVISSSTTRSLRLHPDRPCRYDGFVRPRSEIVFQLELPASSSARGVQVRALDASGDSLRLYWRAGEAARPADRVYDGCCTHPPLRFEWRAAAGQAAVPAQSAAGTLYVTLVNQQGPQAARCSITATLLAPGRGRAHPPAPADGAVAGTSPPASPPLSTPSVTAQRLGSIVPKVRVLRALGALGGAPTNSGEQPLSERLVEARNHPYSGGGPPPESDELAAADWRRPATLTLTLTLTLALTLSLTLTLTLTLGS